ncbi:MAG TPA: hypothetical protein PL041_11870 [Melioribacteraceae bacterium]|nr:hypothetical protein [Melioribacteraceae bacterium]
MKKILIIISILFPLFVIAQTKAENDFKVQSFSLSDKLDENSVIDPEFGKYTAYDFDINNSDHFIIKVKSKEFTPYLLISSPKGKNIFAYPKNNKNEAVLDTVATETGKWSLYVICDTLEAGSFDLKINFCDKKSYAFPTSNNAATLIKYLTLHAEADFGFIVPRCSVFESNFVVSPIKFPQAISSVIDIEKNTYIITFYEGNDENIAEKTYQSIKKSLKDNLIDNYINKEFTKSEIYSKFTKFSSLNKPSVYLRYYKSTKNGTKVTIEIEPK